MNIDEVGSIEIVSAQVGVSSIDLGQAIRNGLVDHKTLGDGHSVVVVIKSAKTFAERKAKESKEAPEYKPRGRVKRTLDRGNE